MHILGKLLGCLCAILAVLAIVWTGRALQVRNSYNMANEKLKDTYAKNAEALVGKERAYRAAINELDRVNFDWGRVWDDVAVGQSDNNGVIINIGSRQELSQEQVLYLFQPKADGSGMVYVGPFRVATVEDERAALEPTWRPRPADPNDPNGARQAESAGWRYGAGWRVRDTIPVEVRKNFTNVEVQFALADERLASRRLNLAYQQKLNTDANQQLQRREGELNGGLPEMEANRGVLPQDKVDGLVKAIEDAEEVRNEELANVDRLRRELKAAYERYEKLKDENLQLTETLPKPAVSVSSRP